jgi:hypothetical protein
MCAAAFFCEQEAVVSESLHGLLERTVQGEIPLIWWGLSAVTRRTNA